MSPLNYGRELPKVLIPYNEFDTKELATQLHGLVSTNREELLERNLLGVVARHGVSIEQSEQIILSGLTNKKIGRFAVVDAIGDVKGSASIYPGLPLKEIRLPIPPIIAIYGLSIRYPFANPNIHAWVDKSDDKLLPRAYENLLFASRNLTNNLMRTKTWTIEPIRSPKYVHDSIREAGLQVLSESRRFDDGESRRKIPPKSTLYVSTTSNIVR